MTLTEIAHVVGGTAHGEATVTGAAFVDSRAPEAEGLFVAVVGERVDGHEFTEAAVAGGAAAVLGSRPTAAPTVVVDDVVEALGVLARHVLSRLDDVQVLAVTGSQGKTGTKDFLAQLLAHAGPTVATAGNFNNEVGVPLTVLHATPETRYLVVEMGARGIGHIRYLCDIARPSVAGVVNVGTAHIGEFGSREAIASAKGEIIEALPEDGVAVLNADDGLVAAMADRTRARTVRFGRSPAVEVGVVDVTTDDLERASFELEHRGGGATVHLQLMGLHQVENAAAAAAMALAAGLDLDLVAEGLTEALPTSRWRMELSERSDGLAVVNDAYNANPESTESALVTLAALGRRGRRTVAVLGEMKELGEDSAGAHRRVGGFAARHGVDVVVAVGEPAAEVARGAREVAEWPGEAILTPTRDEALAWLRQNVSADDVVLVKASRGAALEHVVDGLLHGPAGTGREEGDR